MAASEPAPLSQRILETYDDLTRGERRIADQLLGDPDTLVLKSATDISEQVGVSKATTARFFRRLGYPSFKSAQKAARVGEMPTPRPGLATGAARTGVGQLAEHLANDVQNLVRSMEALRSGRAGAGHPVAGAGGKALGGRFRRQLSPGPFRPRPADPDQGRHPDDPDRRLLVPEEFASIRSTDAMIALGIGRKTRSLRSIMRSAVHAGAQVIYVTDQASRSGLDTASVTLRCRTRGTSVYESVVAPVSLVTYLCSAVALRIGQSAIERLQYIENIHAEWGDVVSGDL